MMKLIVVNQTSANIDEKNLQLFCRKILQILLKKRLRKTNQLKFYKELILVFVTPEQMKTMNFKFRLKKKPTDVLSFSSEDPKIMGELLFCLDVLKKQAKQQAHSIEAEFAYMFIHGFLHLLGYDHELSETEEKLMFSIQDRIFAEIYEKTNKKALKKLNLDSGPNIFKT